MPNSETIAHDTIPDFQNPFADWRANVHDTETMSIWERRKAGNRKINWFEHASFPDTVVGVHYVPDYQELGVHLYLTTRN